MAHDTPRLTEGIIFGDKIQGYSQNSGAYAERKCFLYLGSAHTGLPVKIKVVANVSAGTTGKIKVYDITNSQVIAELTGISNTTLSVLDMGTITNCPTEEAVFKVEIGTDDANQIQLYHLLLEF